MNQSDHIQHSEPQLAPMAPLARNVIPAAAIAALVLGAAWFGVPSSSERLTPQVPTTQAELSDRLMTIVDPTNRNAVRGAIDAMQLPAPQRAEIEQAVIDQRIRIAWIVFTDSIDPDGDIVAVEAAGYTQHIVLSKAWTPVAVPLVSGSISITAVRDGGGGGVTVALATRNGPVAMQIMLPGDRIQVASP
jgi:hypothetical protein